MGVKLHMKKLNNQLNWKGSINKTATRKLKSDYSVRDKLDCPKSTNNSVDYKIVPYKEIWTRFRLLANTSINAYKSTHQLVGDERIKTDILQDYIEHLDKDNITTNQTKCNSDVIR